MMRELKWCLGGASAELSSIYENDMLVHVIVQSINHVVESRNVVVQGGNQKRIRVIEPSTPSCALRSTSRT